MNRNKKALSEIVTVILIILLVIAAIIIIWAILRPILTPPISPVTQCIGITFDVEDAKHNSTSPGTLSFRARKTGGEDIEKLRFIISNSTGSFDLSGSASPNATQKTNIPGLHESQVYTISGVSQKPTKIEVAAVVLDEGGELANCPSIAGKTESITSI